MHNLEPQLWGRNAARWDVSISLHAKKKIEYWQPDNFALQTSHDQAVCLGKQKMNWDSHYRWYLSGSNSSSWRSWWTCWWRGRVIIFTVHNFALLICITLMKPKRNQCILLNTFKWLTTTWKWTYLVQINVITKFGTSNSNYYNLQDGMADRKFYMALLQVTFSLCWLYSF